MTGGQRRPSCSGCSHRSWWSSALGLLFAKKAVHAALCIGGRDGRPRVVYFAQQAPFLGSAQIFVYTGAVMMLFLFVVMLIGVDSSDSLVETIKGQRGAAVLLGLGAGRRCSSACCRTSTCRPRSGSTAERDGNISIAAPVFGNYVFAFEVTGALLITAALGAMVLAHRERLMPSARAQRRARRARGGPDQGAAARPRRLARHNAIDIPALLPRRHPDARSRSRGCSRRGVRYVADEVSTAWARS